MEGVLDTIDNQFEAYGLNPFSRFTLSSHCLETCIATEASAQPAQVYLNPAGLGYVLPEMVNNGSRGACGIDSLTVYPEAFDCSDAGQQNVVLTVIDQNGCTNTAMTWVEVIDTIKPVVVCKNITVYVGESCAVWITPADVDDGSYDACGIDLSININYFDCNDIGSHTVTLTAADPSGNTRSCHAIVTVEEEINVECQDVVLHLGENGLIVIDAFDLITGNPENYSGYTFTIEPETLYCDQLGDHLVTLTAIDPEGEVTTCSAIVHLDGPDADCDGVSDPCDECDGGDDRQDSDGDGVPDCADWDGWEHLPEDWKCANNKVFVCHNGIVICINKHAVQAHLGHGDFLGPCSAVSCAENQALQTSDHHAHLETSNMDWADPAADYGHRHEDDADIVLAENRPNPFFPETLIRYYLPVKERVTLTVFDMTGRQVARLTEGIRDAGWHEVPFDGHQQPDGFYVYRLQTSSQVLIGTMCLTR